MEQNKIIYIKSFDSEKESSGEYYYFVIEDDDNKTLLEDNKYTAKPTAVAQAISIMGEKGYCLDESQGEKGIECCECEDGIHPTKGRSTIWRKLYFIEASQNDADEVKNI